MDEMNRNLKTLLLVEDDPMLAKGLKLNFELEGYVVQWASSIKEATESQKVSAASLVVLDLGLPDGNGLDFCKNLREHGNKVPVIILTAQADEDSVVKGLEVGANDYVKKPFSNKELAARIKGLLRDYAPPADRILRAGKLKISEDQRTVHIGDKEVDLNRREFDVLTILAKRPGIVVTRENLLEQLNSSEEIFDRTVDSHISHIRSKLKRISDCNVVIKSEYGVGYRLVVLD